MNQDLGLKILSQIMAWSDDRAREEFGWLRLMARLLMGPQRITLGHSPKLRPARVTHVLRVAFGILEPETIKQTLESTTLAFIIPRLSRGPYSRWHRLQGT
jgi:hypothetical protein